MATPAAVLSILVKANTAQAQAALRDTQKDLAATDKATGKTGKGFMAIGKFAKVGVVGAAASAAVLGPKLISLASDAEETASKFKVVFGRSADEAAKRLDAFSKATGTSKFALKGQAAQFQALIRPMGLTTKESGKLSVGMTKLATDLASFNNSSVEEAITALQSGLVGEAEPLRRFGVQLSAARVEAFAYANGIAKQGKELTAAQKAQASYGIIMKDTTLAQGDAVRTADSFANQFKRLKSQTTDLATELGTKLIPVATTVVSAITGLISKFQNGGAAAGGFGAKIASVWETVKGAVGSAISFLVGLFKKHQDDYRQVAKAAGNVGKAIAFVWGEVVFPVIKRVLPGIVQIIRGAFGVISGLVKTLAAVLTGDWRRAWEGVKDIFRSALEGVLGILRVGTAPIRELVSRIAGKVKAPFVDAFEAIKGVAEDVLGVFKDIVGVVEDIIDFIDDIKIPKIDIPFIGGSPRPGFEKKVATGGVGGTYAIANRVASMFGLGVSSGYRSPSHNAAVGGVPNSLHTHGSPGNPGAIDLVGSAQSMYAASAWAAKHLSLAENLVHDVGSGLHLHLGFFRRGGKVPGQGSGDTVPAMLEPGEFVIRKKIVDQFGPTFFASMNGMKKGGRVGKNTAATMAAIAAATRTSRRLPVIEQAAVLAEVAGDLGRQIAAADELVRFWEGQLGIAQASGRGITAAAQGLLSARQARAAFNQAPGEDPMVEINRQLVEINKQIADNQTKILALANQGPQVVAAVVAAVNGSIGGQVGLGFHGIRSTPGSVANL